MQIVGPQFGLDDGLRVFGAEICAVHFASARLSENGMIGIECRPDRQSFVSGRRLNPCMTKWSTSENLPIGDAIKCATARHRQVVQWYSLMQMIQQMHKHILEAVLHGIGEVHITLRDFRVPLTRLTEFLYHATGEMTGQAYLSIGRQCHALVAAKGLEISEIGA